MIEDTINFVENYLCNDYQYAIAESVSDFPQWLFIKHRRRMGTSSILFQIALYKALVSNQHRVLMLTNQKFPSDWLRDRHKNEIYTLRNQNLRLKNDSHVFCIAYNSSSNVSGLGVDTLIIDDSSAVENLSSFWVSLNPCVNLNGQIIVTSSKDFSTIRNINYKEIDFSDKYMDCEV